MSAYLLVEADVTDRDRFMVYAKEVRKLVRECGGEYLVIGGPIELLETEDTHDNGRTIVISKWPSRQVARDFGTPMHTESSRHFEMGLPRYVSD